MKYLITVLVLVFSGFTTAAETKLINESDFEKEWKLVPTIEAVTAAITPDGEFLAKSKNRISAELTFTITSSGKATDIEVVSVTPDRQEYKKAFADYYAKVSFKPLVDKPVHDVKVKVSTFFGGCYKGHCVE